MSTNLQIARHYKRQKDITHPAILQSEIKFPEDEEKKKELGQKIVNHLQEIHRLSYDQFTDHYHGFYRGIKVVCDVMYRNCKFYFVAGEFTERYHEATENELLNAIV